MKPATTSSTVAGIAYDPVKKVLSVKFHDGNTYHYDGVSKEVFQALENATSVGSHLHKHIKGKFPHRKALP